MVKRRVQVGKIDLDTCGAAYVLAVTREDAVEVLRGGQATEEDLANPEVLCIEVGGNGRVAEGNFDHHGAGAEGLRSATLQAYEMVVHGPSESPVVQSVITKKMVYLDFPEVSSPFKFGVLPASLWNKDPKVKLLVELGMEGWPDQMAGGSRPARSILANICRENLEDVYLAIVFYIDIIDVEWPDGLRRLGPVGFPTLSDVFAGMLLITREPAEQLHRGVEILEEISGRWIDPFGKIPLEEVSSVWASYAEAKAKNNRQITKAVERAQWGATRNGLKLAWLETDFFGAPGALYGVGAQVVVAFSPRFGPAGVPKFTVAGNGIKVDAVLPELSAREPGWGGPATGTIIGSPREGSKLTLNEVVGIVRKVL